MPKGVKFEADDDTDTTCDSDSILETSPVFTKATKTNRKFNFTLDNTDSDSDVVCDTPKPKRLRTGLNTKHMNNSSDNLNHRQEPETSGVAARQNGISHKNDLTQQTTSGGSLSRTQTVDVSSSNNDSDLDIDTLATLPGGTSKKTNPKSKLPKSLYFDDNLNHRQEPKTFGVASKLNGVSHKNGRRQQTTNEGSLSEKTPTVDVSSSDNDSDLESFPTSSGAASEKKLRFFRRKIVKNVDEAVQGHQRITPKLTKQRTFVVPDPSVPPLPTLSPREKSLQKLVELRKQRSAKMGTADEPNQGRSFIPNFLRSKNEPTVQSRLNDTGSYSSDEEFFAALRKPAAIGGRMKAASANDKTKKKEPVPQREQDEAGQRKLKFFRRKPKKTAAAVPVVTVLDSSPDISEDEFEKIIDGIPRQQKGGPQNGVDAAVTAAASASATVTDCIEISEDNKKRRSRNWDSSPDISEGEFERLVNSINQQREGRRRNLPTASVTAAASASATSPDRIAVSNDTRKRRSRNRSSSQGRTTEFVAASSLLDSPLRCSPSRPCRRSCPCKDNFTRSPRTPETRQSLDRPNRPSANRWQNTSMSEASGANDSMVNTVRAVTQMEKDEEMARRMQEDMDRQYAAALASGAASTPQSQRQRGSRLPASIAVDEAEEMEARINMLTDWEWQVHVSIVQGTDVPPVPPGEYRQSPDEALDPTLLEHLYSHPDVMNLRRTTNNRTTTRSRVAGIPPVVLPDRNVPRARAATRRRRGGTAAARRRGNGVLGLDFTDGMLSDSLLDNVLFTDAQAYFEELSADIRTRRGGLNILDGIARRGRGLNMSAADGNDYEELLALEEQLGAVVTRVGLSAEQISRLPLTTYKAATASSDATQCHVCMSDYEEGDRLRLLTCFHSFHCDCIDQWIKDNPTCPVCRIEVQV